MTKWMLLNQLDSGVMGLRQTKSGLMMITMRRILICFAVFLLAIYSCSCNSNPPKDSENEEMVYICVSNTAYAYHIDEYCQGLQRCSHKIKKVSRKEAEEKYKRKPCRWCTTPTIFNPN